MAYDLAISKAWLELDAIADSKKYSVNFLNDEYDINLEQRRIFSLSCNVPTQDFICVLLLHYLLKKIKGLPSASGEWISFRQLDGGEGYYPAFKRRVIAPISKKYGRTPEAIYGLIDRFKAKRIQLADVGIVLETFKEVPVLIELWKADEEFGPEVNVLFDRNITHIFCTEDIVVLAEFIAHQI